MDRVRYIRGRAPAKLERFWLKCGDILFSHINSDLHLGKTAVVTSDMPLLHGMNLLLLRPDRQRLSSKFLHHWLDFCRRSGRFIAIAQHAVNQSSLNQKKITSLAIPLPPMAQQDAIVGEIEKQFSRLDEALANLKRVKANLKRYKAAILKAAVEGRLVPTEAELARVEGRSYETGAQLLQRILETRRSQWERKGRYKESTGRDSSELPRLPEGWTWATMPQLGELSRGKSKHRPRDDPKLYGGAYPFIQTGDVRKSGGAIQEHSQTYSELGVRQSRLWPAGTLCITIAANIAETGILAFPACFPDSVVGFVGEAGPVTTRYLEFFLRTAREALARFAPATAQKNINLDVLRGVALPLPPAAEQDRIVAEADRRLSFVHEVEAQVDANLMRAKHLHQLILASAFCAT